MVGSAPHSLTNMIWPPLPIAAWQDTRETLHLWTQVVGKIRLALAPKINHWWHSTLYVTTRGLTTSTIHYGTGTFQITFDFLNHQLLIETSDGITRTIELTPRSVADFYQAVMSTLKDIGIDVQIWTMPQEVTDPIPFEQDTQHVAYDPESAQRFWRILVQADRLMTVFRSRYAGKCSPVHFFWGSFDLAVTRFSGRQAPDHPGGVPNMADWVTREAYSHEVSSCGFWFGGGSIEALFYAYAYPTPDGFKEYSIQPETAFYSADMQEFVLPYEAVRQADDPDTAVLEFLQTTYEAAANLGGWDRATLEYKPVVKG
ncbi:hypothetical protein IQ268_22885 [Oculatella sp. LEGE 06141]|uniref:DUF5996 family protein n=1 Tax=Oculatella sp. LEGE 06141 TaxID=1828648 RepID=UPI00187E6CC1|nr:DUF5996 family protein [Oculatella sp. LEGE 06141]MBE9181412.1 hypothetical protein [Oculatella sp. LEGE 06141]